MINSRFATRLLCVGVVGIGLLASCAQVPEDSVVLSEDVGSVLEELRQKNATLVDRMFSDRKDRVIEFIDKEYGPFIVSEAMKKTNAVETLSNLVKAGKGDQALKLMQIMVNQSVAQIQKRRASLLQPIETQQSQVKAAFDSAFGVAIKGNETTTGLLRSVRQVDASQNAILGDLGLKDLRSKVNADAAAISNKLAVILSGAHSVESAIDGATACKLDDVQCKFEKLKSVLDAAVDSVKSAKQ
jgi:hypothetical protein